MSDTEQTNRNRDRQAPAGITTRLIHTGEQPDPATGAVIPPIYQTTTFAFPDNASMEDYMEGRREGYIYTRYGHPNWSLAEAKLADLEGAEKALLTSSGMAAASTIFLTLTGRGDHVVAPADEYGGTFGLLHELLPRFGVETTFVDTSDLAQIEAAFRKETRVLFLETPGNPGLTVTDIAAAARLAHDRGIQVVVDNTFATPYNQRPLELGADVVMHSATKYLNGHSDVLAGFIAGSAGFIDRATGVFRKLGGNLNGFDAWLLIRGMKTLALRMERHNRNAQRLAEFLADHPAVERVLYPGLPTHPGHEVARRQMSGYGGVLSVVLKGGGEAASALIDRCRLFTRAVSLGSVESLITQPVAGTHHSVPGKYRALAGISPGLVRIAAGIEEAEDLIADLEQALSGL